MSIKVYDTVSGSTLIFPALPEKINFSAATKFFEYELINTGDVKVPMGEELSKISWSAILPGEKKKNAPYVSDWKSPREIQSVWSVWRTQGRKLRLTIDGTPINHGVYLESYEVEYSGGFGDCTYSIEFVIAKDIVISIEPRTEPDESVDVTEKEEEPQTRTYTVKTGDCLWEIAKKFYGKGSKYEDIKKANNMRSNTIYTGDVLIIP